MKAKKKALALMALSLCLPLMGLSSCGGQGDGASNSIIASHDHVYETVSETKATCTEKGKKTERCAICGKETSEETPPLGHSFSPWAKKSEPTCTEAEILQRNCTHEGCKEEETKEGEPALGHLWGEWVREGEKMIRACSREGCGEKEEKIAPLVKLFALEEGSLPYTDNVADYLSAEDPNVSDYLCSDEGNQGYKVRWLNSYDGATACRIECSKDEGFSDPMITEADASASQAYLYNLEKASLYYIRVVVTDAEGEHASNVTTFETSDLGPRLLKVGGIHNVRDVGGYMTSEGRTLQNMLIRGGALSPSTFEAYKDINITEEGKAYMSQTLKIKTDFDLRLASENRAPGTSEDSGLTQSPIPNANLEYYGANGYESIFSEKETVRKIFSALSDEKRYPVYIHCTGGADRTGTYCFLFNALLGVSEKELIHDYEYTSFSLYGERNSKSEEPYHFKQTLERIKSDYEGDNLQEKTENFLKSVGVTETEIYNIKAIMHAQPTKEEDKPTPVTYNQAFDFSSGSIVLNAANPTATSAFGGYDGKIYSLKVQEDVSNSGGLHLYIGSYGYYLRGDCVRYSHITADGYDEYYVDGKREVCESAPTNASLSAGTVLGLSATIKDDSTMTLAIYQEGKLLVSYDYPRVDDEISSGNAKFVASINSSRVSSCTLSSPNE